MKLICVGVGLCRCLVLRFRKANILLDCATPLHAALSALGAKQSSAPEPVGDACVNTSRDGGGASAAEGPGGSSGCDDEDSAGVPDLMDLTPFLPLLHTLELHAALISSPEALLALPHLLQYNDAVQSYGAESDGPRAGKVEGVAGETGDSSGTSHPRSPWHHVGRIRGPVYCTQAALDTAEQLVAERLAAEEAVAAAAAALHSPARLPGSADLGLEPLPEAQEVLLAACWRRRPAWRDVRYCLDRVRPVRYGQVVPLDSYELTAVPYPSGSGFGHAVWQIADGAERCRTVLYLPDASPSHPFAPSLPLELVAAPDALLLGPDCLQRPPGGGGGGGGGGLAPAGGPSSAFPSAAASQQLPLPPPAPTRPPHRVAEEAVLRALVSGGSALVPVYATGEAWELLEALAGALASSDLGAVPLLYVGPRSGTSLALASVSLEALAPERQAAVYVPQHPFAFDALMQAGRLVAATSLADPAAQRCLQQPVVVLAAADSLLYPAGPALELLLRFGPHPNNLLLLPHAAPPAALRGIERLYNRAAAAPPLRMRILHVPLRGGAGGSAAAAAAAAAAGPSPASVLELLYRLQPRHLLATNRDLALLQQQQQQLRQQQPDASPPPPLARESVIPYGWLHQVRVTLPRNVHSALVSPELLQRLQWLGAGPGLQLARLHCLLVFRGGAWHADPVPGGAAGTSADAAAATAALAAGGAVAGDQLLLAAGGGPALGPLLEALAGHGFTHVSVRSEGQGLCLALDGTDATLLLRNDGAHVTSGCPAMRAVLTQCLMRQLTTL